MKHCGKPAAYVVGDLGGLEQFVCEEHADPNSPDATWIVRTTINDWFRARALPMPETPRNCNQARKEPDA